MTFPETPADWHDVSSGVHFGYIDGFVAGHAAGHRAGWQAGFEAGTESATARDLEFARMVEQEYHRRELQGERASDLVRRLIDALRTEQNRQNHPNFYPQTQPRRAA